MSKAAELAKDPSKIVELNTKNDGRFKKGDPRTAAAGRKGGSAPHATGMKKPGMKYRYKGFTIRWDGQKHLWRAEDGATKLYGRSYKETTEMVTKYREDHQEFIKTPIEEA
jgi:hypothetical protein